jgi:hypothetical protein
LRQLEPDDATIVETPVQDPIALVGLAPRIPSGAKVCDGFRIERRPRKNIQHEPIMIPGKIVRFLQDYANVAFAGTRNRNLVPYGHRVSGWRVGDEGRTLTAFIAEPFTPRLVESLEDNGEFALTVEEFPSHETYQFKGRYLRHRPVQDDDVKVVDTIRRRFAKQIRPIYPDAPDSIWHAFILKPCLAVEFEVHEIYLQTPGPGAGARLVPPPEEAR